MIRQLFCIKFNTHRQTLNHFDPVTGGVLCRQQGEGAAGTHVQANHFPGVLHVIAVDVADNRRGLADTHMGKLRLFKVSVYPQIVCRNDRHQRRGRADLRPWLNGTAGDIAGHRADDFGTLQG